MPPFSWSATSTTNSSSDLAVALGWEPASIQRRRIEHGSTELDLSRTYIAGEGALIVAKTIKRNGSDPVDSAALFGYHVAGEWGVLADERLGLTIFNSRWRDEKDWYRLPRISLDSSKTAHEIFEALTPVGLSDGRLTQIAQRQKKPTGVLVSVDDALVDRLDRWRAEALRFSTKNTVVDEQLQQVYAQLFVLRTVEDRKLDLGVPLVSSVIDPRTGEINERKWNSLIRAARSRIGGELFSTSSGKDIPRHVLSGVIHDLYEPTAIPIRGERYNFSWIDADVLGAAYEKYLSTILQQGALLPQSDLFLEEERKVERFSVRKRKGVYYTPKFITGCLATSTVDDYFDRGDRADPPYIIDFACGSGAFLVAAIERSLHHLKSVDPTKSWARELISQRRIVGIDVDPNAVNLARLRLWQRLLEEPDALPLPSLSDVVRVGDGLDRESWGDLDREYDIVLGNPPFLATSKVDMRERLESRFVTAKGRYDYSSLFIEQATKVLGAGGAFGMVVPNRFLRNTSGASLRGLLVDETALRYIIDFGDTRPFEADAYIACIVGIKRAPLEPLPTFVKVVEVKRIDRDFVGGLLLNKEVFVDSDDARIFEARHPSGSEPWMLVSAADQQVRVNLQDSSSRLDSLAIIAQGIRTGANDFFIFDLVSDDGDQLCEVTNGLGEKAIIERDLLRPVIQGSEVQRFSRVSGARRLLYPHRNRAAISEPELSLRYPYAWEYFERNRLVLGGRASLKKSGGSFYELVWPRDEGWLNKPKLLIRDLAPRTSFAIDDAGCVYLVGGTAIMPFDSDLLPALMAYLNSSFISDYVSKSTPGFQGGYQKFEPKHVQSIPVVARVTDDPLFLRELTELAWQRVDARAETREAEELEKRIDNLVSVAVSGVA